MLPASWVVAGAGAKVPSTRVDPKPSPHQTQVDPTSTPNRPQSIPHRPRADLASTSIRLDAGPNSTPNGAHNDPTSTQHEPHIDQTWPHPHRPDIGLTPAQHRPELCGGGLATFFAIWYPFSSMTSDLLWRPKAPIAQRFPRSRVRSVESATFLAERPASARFQSLLVSSCSVTIPSLAELSRFGVGGGVARQLA